MCCMSEVPIIIISLLLGISSQEFVLDVKLNTGMTYFVMHVHFKMDYNKEEIRCIKMFRQINRGHDTHRALTQMFNIKIC